MAWKRICRRLHTWLGLVSGGVVVVVCLTGALYAWKDEIEAATQPWRFVQPRKEATLPQPFVQPQKEATLPPSEILRRVEPLGGGLQPFALTYGEAADAIRVDLAGPEGEQAIVWLHPADGHLLKIIRKEAGDFDFFRFVLDGHRRLWLPPAVGKPLVGSCVLLFLLVLLTGLVVWWPKVWTRDRLRRLFRIERDGGRRRLLFDLHVVLGMYAALVLILLAATGLVWSFEWYSRGVYRLTGGKELKAYKLPVSDTTAVKRASGPPADELRGGQANGPTIGPVTARAQNLTCSQTDSRPHTLTGSSPDSRPLSLPAAFPADCLYHRLRAEEPEATGFYIVMPRRPEDVCRVSIVHRRGSYYQTDNRFFDRYSLNELSGEGPYAGRYRTAPLPDRIRRMNLELHDGRIAGRPGKLIVCLAALVGASLPVTGYLIWWNKRKGKRRRKGA